MKPYLKWTAISVGSIVAIAHIGVLGHLIRREPNRVQVPTINIPRGTPYSSYKIEAGKDGYTIEYNANDPAILESQRSLDLDKSRSGYLVVTVLKLDQSIAKINIQWKAPVIWEVK